MENEIAQEVKLVTVRGATNFGFQLANNLIERLEKDDVAPSQWPVRLPITIKQITKLPEVNNNSKVAKRVAEAARTVWKEMRTVAIEIENDMMLHPEYYGLEEHSHDEQEQEFVWHHLSIEIEKIAGNVFVTDYDNEDAAKANVYILLSPMGLKKYMDEFEGDYKDFINEVREAIRACKQLRASVRLELICSLNEHTKAAEQIVLQKK